MKVTIQNKKWILLEFPFDQKLGWLRVGPKNMKEMDNKKEISNS